MHSLRTSIRKAKNFISNDEIVFFTFHIMHFHYGTGKLDAKNIACLWWHWVIAGTLAQVHTVQAKAFYLDQSFASLWGRPWNRRHEEGGNRTFPIFDILVRNNASERRPVV